MRTTLCYLGLLCAVASGAPAGQPYANREKGFSLVFPAGWELKENVMGASILGVSPPEGPTDRFRENLHVLVKDLPRPMTLKNYYDGNLALMKKLFTGFKLLQSGTARLGTDQARWLVYLQRADNLKVKVLLYYVIRGSRGYAITCSALPKTFAKWRPTFEAIAKSFRTDPGEKPSLTRRN